jgi:hypothetical protein
VWIHLLPLGLISGAGSLVRVQTHGDADKKKKRLEFHKEEDFTEYNRRRRQLTARIEAAYGEVMGEAKPIAEIRSAPVLARFEYEYPDIRPLIDRLAEIEARLWQDEDDLSIIMLLH